MNRREFSTALTLAALSGIVPKAAHPRVPDGEANAVSDEAAQLYQRALVLDCNLAPTDEDELKLPMSRVALDRVRESGVNVIKWSLGGIDSGFADTMAEIASVDRLFEVHPAYFTQVRVAADLARAKREGRLGVILSFESVEMLEGRLDRLELFRNLGVKVMQLSYNRHSAFANGVLEPQSQGLTSLGREAVRRMNALGIAIDLSHANEPTTSEVLALSSKPPIMTHGGCAAVHPHPRNKTDEQLRALAARGGVFGIYDLMYLTASPRQPTLEDYMQHIVHALNVAGEEHVGVGSDASIEPFDTSPQNLAEFRQYTERRQKAGVAAPEEDRPPYVQGLNTPRRMEIIADQLLRRGYPEHVAEKVLGANFARVLSEVWTV
jgi:membrane dipeptidase